MLHDSPMLLFLLVFLPLTWGGFWLLQRVNGNAAKVFLMLASLILYSQWNIRHVPLLLISLLANYLAGIWLFRHADGGRRALWVMLAIVAFDLGVLGYFKFTDYVLINLRHYLGWDLQPLKLTTPLAFSFITFQAIAFVVDSYHQRLQAHRWLDFSLFNVFFPHLFAGPLVYHRDMMPQFASLANSRLQPDNLAAGMYLFSIGLAKKVLLADYFATYVTATHNAARVLDFTEAWLGSLCYTLQLYFDFSGYSDMAIGVALWFNIRLPINFLSPYQARDIRDFWRRWHITLSRFLREYVYIPLGGSRLGRWRTVFNLLLTFFLSGLWHGTGGTFVVWGLMHGAGVVFHRWWSNWGLRLPGWLGWIITFQFVNLSWVLFRSNGFGEAGRQLSAMAGHNGVYLPIGWQDSLGFLTVYGIQFGALYDMSTADLELLFLALVAGLALVWYGHNSMVMLERFRPTAWRLVFGVGMLVLSMFSMTGMRSFIYFIF